MSALQGNVIAVRRHWMPRTRTHFIHSFLVHSITVNLRFGYMHTQWPTTTLFLSHGKDRKYVNHNWGTSKSLASSSSPLHCPHSPTCWLELQPWHVSSNQQDWDGRKKKGTHFRVNSMQSYWLETNHMTIPTYKRALKIYLFSLEAICLAKYQVLLLRRKKKNKSWDRQFVVSGTCSLVSTH